MKSVVRTMKRGWNAPVTALLTSSVMMLPLSSLLALGIGDIAPFWLVAVVAAFQIAGSVLIAGWRTGE